LATSWSSPSLIALARSSPDPAQHHRPAAGAGLRLGRELVRHVGRLGEANAAGLEEEARWGWRRRLVWGLRQNLGTYRSATGIRLRARGRHLEKTGIRVAQSSRTQSTGSRPQYSRGQPRRNEECPSWTSRICEVTGFPAEIPRHLAPDVEVDTGQNPGICTKIRSAPGIFEASAIERSSPEVSPRGSRVAHGDASHQRQSRVGAVPYALTGANLITVAAHKEPASAPE
jgi:hypothetical protein